MRHSSSETNFYVPLVFYHQMRRVSLRRGKLLFGNFLGNLIRKLALALDVTADELVFDAAERMPLVTDKELIKQWEKLEDLPEEDRQALKVLVEGLLMRRQISRLQPTA